MSTKVVRKLLQSTSDLASIEAKEGSSSLGKKRKREPKKRLGKDKLVELHLHSILRLDSAMSRNSQSQQDVLKRTTKKQKGEKPKKSLLSGKGPTVVGNSRSSSSLNHAQNREHLPTFNKKRHEKEKKEKSLKKIAALLEKTKKKHFKSSE